MPFRLASALATLALAAGATASCIDRDTAQAAVRALQSAPPAPDTLPVITNPELPFAYPPALYAQRVQGNVTLRIFIDSLGAVHAESTSVTDPSGYPALDSAAVIGSRDLRFRPAKFGARPGGVSILFPVFFRHPDGTPLPGDTILKQPVTSDGQRARTP